ncbi:FAD/NAD(P)-binding domain-containing protein [Cucurbitaria berberidis CBS 394.84]|uniref:FAD/NAD(P)-binding domain-containing protein n=1 Tax=Cucurbitaria berberidis CBS 394.84 TaxID=1168544 RepID=A0A9P4L8W4_9PLEO|nr:FAD/NAD(P)-binding domain-containing protein [Cucurbitaria berberidis CBS 394.84]KAF1845723.1 FAD/NAD(P)-binding domain-containing protein [Cucurbitaria berberidis CBS 394.84]
MHVLISGAGIAGPTLAWWLAKTGARITIVEKAHSLLSHGQNIDISGSARTIIKKMGLRDKILELNTTEKGAQFIDTDGRPFASFPVREGGAAASLTSEWEILRGDLASVFYEATKDFPNVEYVFGTTISKVVSNDNTSVKVEFSNGQTQEYDLLVAADGQWSKVRKQCFPPEAITVIDKNMYVGYWTIPRLPVDNEYWNIYQALGSRMVTTRPDPHGTIRAMVSRMPCNAAQKKAWQDASKSDGQTQQDLLKKEFADAGWQAHRLLDAMDQAPDFYFQAIQQIKMTTWSNSRVICLGDTAFAPTPLTGMGTSLAIIGAYVLAGELSKLDENEHPAQALEAYEKKFRPFVEEVQVIPSFIPGVAHPMTAWKIWLFQVVVRVFALLASSSWVVKWFGKNDDDEDFKLPLYPGWESVSGQGVDREKGVGASESNGLSGI